ncbi:MAG TPA: hypothetical protein VHK01_05825 [Lacipirellulaceae bacterium]|jgi:hypothetical protein|nr:hypothetical protein [Lacipirellulaceae bacterium]
MNAAAMWSRILIIVGLTGMLIGALDPLEGSFVILPSAFLVAAGGWVNRSRYRTLLSWSFALIAIGVTAMLVLSSWGGIGGNSGHSIWWGLFILPYPIGWILGLVGAALAVIESWKYHMPDSQAAQ